jgi:riboflavin kinase/FMN adenylyltransferase
VNELQPAHGIYATIAVVDGVHHPSVTSIGVRPMFADGRVVIEVHLLDGAQDLYGRSIRLALVQWLREEQMFETIDALRAQIAADCAQAASLFEQMAL